MGDASRPPVGREVSELLAYRLEQAEKRLDHEIVSRRDQSRETRDAMGLAIGDIRKLLDDDYMTAAELENKFVTRNEMRNEKLEHSANAWRWPAVILGIITCFTAIGSFVISVVHLAFSR